MPENYSNNGATTLVSTISDSDTSMEVVSGATLPVDLPYRLTVDDEIVLVTARAGALLTITRAAEGTTAAAHTAGVAVDHYLTAGSLLKLTEDGCASGPVASRPAFGRAGRLYLPDNSLVFFRDTGSAWENRLVGRKLTKPPLASTLTQVNFGSTATSDGNDGLTIEPPNNNGDNVRLLVESAPATPFTFTVCMNATLVPAVNFQFAGICQRQSSDGKLEIISYGQSDQTIAVNRYTNPTTFSATVGQSANVGMPELVWLRIADDGTNKLFQVSNNGLDWRTLYGVARTTFLTADQIGLAVNINTANTTVTTKTRYLHYLKA